MPCGRKVFHDLFWMGAGNSHTWGGWSGCQCSADRDLGIGDMTAPAWERSEVEFWVRGLLWKRMLAADLQQTPMVPE